MASNNSGFDRPTSAESFLQIFLLKYFLLMKKKIRNNSDQGCLSIDLLLLTYIPSVFSDDVMDNLLP